MSDNEVIYTADEATGGTHMTLVLAGYYGIDQLAAETLKIDKSKESLVFPIIYPVVEKMASIVKSFVNEYEVKKDLSCRWSLLL